VLSRVDHISTSFDVLVEAFGTYGAGDPDKTLAQWDLHTPSGWAEVYDYKSYAAGPEDVTEWHVQADKEEGFEYVYMAIREAASRLGESSGLGES
jgi:hypothetical protein